MVETVALQPMEFKYCQGENSTRKRRKGKGGMPWNNKGRAGFEEAKLAQGLPADFALPGFTVAEACAAVRNGVPLAMGRALAKAVIRSTEGGDGC